MRDLLTAILALIFVTISPTSVGADVKVFRNGALTLTIVPSTLERSGDAVGVHGVATTPWGDTAMLWFLFDAACKSHIKRGWIYAEPIGGKEFTKEYNRDSNEAYAQLGRYLCSH